MCSSGSSRRRAASIAILRLSTTLVCPTYSSNERGRSDAPHTSSAIAASGVTRRSSATSPESTTRRPGFSATVRVHAAAPIDFGQQPFRVADVGRLLERLGDHRLRLTPLVLELQQHGE